MSKKAIGGGAIVLLLAVVLVGIAFDIPPYFWLPVAVIVIVFGFGASRVKRD